MRERKYETRAGLLGSLITKLELKSQVSAAQVGRSVRDSDGDIGGNRPGGGIDRKDDRERQSVLKSADYFRKKQRRCVTDSDFDRVIVEIEAVLEAWKRMPLEEGHPPAPGDPQFKRWVAESEKDNGELARLFNVTRQHIHQIRKDYRDQEAA